MTTRISIPELRDLCGRDLSYVDPDDILALVEAVEAAYHGEDVKGNRKCLVCGQWSFTRDGEPMRHEPDCPGARFDFGEET